MLPGAHAFPAPLAGMHGAARRVPLDAPLMTRRKVLQGNALKGTRGGWMKGKVVCEMEQQEGNVDRRDALKLALYGYASFGLEVVIGLFSDNC